MSNKPHNRPKKSPRTTSVSMVMDADLSEEHDLAYEELVRAQELNDNSEEGKAKVAKAREKLDKAWDKLRDKGSTRFKFQAIGRKNYDKVLSEHPPSDEQMAELEEDEQLQFNPDTFPAAIIARCLVEPEIPREEAEEWFNSDEWNDSEITVLMSTAMAANITHKDLRLGNG